MNATPVTASKFPNFLSTWSTRRVIVACALWLVGAPVLGMIGLILAGLIAAALSGDQKIGFSASLTNWSLAWFFVPPLLLVTSWLWSRRGQSPPP
ncbi:MAG: hypothetical protein ACJ78I_04410 [Gemmatimonadaceae bacterium]